MAKWQLHWLEAEGGLQDWQGQIVSEIETARDVIARLVAIPRLDILLQRVKGAVIPEIGMLGRAYRKSLLSITFDPSNRNFSACVSNGTLCRQVAHEVHHCLRMAGPGYGRSLGEALVSEGLAGQFVSMLFGSPPEPWECAVDDTVLCANLPDPAVLSAGGYDHAAWFFGTDRDRPRWFGYTLGYRLVGLWLDRVNNVDGPTWVSVSAATVLSETWGILAAQAR